MSKVIKINPFTTVRIESGAVKNIDGFAVADKKLGKLYPRMFSEETCFIKAGESVKSIERVQKLLSKMARHGLHRDDTLTVIGGGSIGDMAGFAASIYMRGIDWRFIPTTLLAMADSCIGGKTAINIDKFKNLAGSFHQAMEVTIDPFFLQTLSNEEYLSGLGEVIKTALLFDKELYELLINKHKAIIKRDSAILTDMIYRVCLAKAKVVNDDPLEHGLRTLLNLGHTAAHMIESASGFTIPHGNAVVMGICIEAKFGQELGVVSKNTLDDIQTITKLYGFASSYDNSKKKLHKALRLDKKQGQTGLKIPLITEVGHAVIQEVPLDKADGLLSYF